MSARRFRLVHEGSAAILRIEEDRGQRALARTSGWTLSYQGELPSAVRDLVLAIGSKFSTLAPTSIARAELDERPDPPAIARSDGDERSGERARPASVGAVVAALRDLVASLAPVARLDESADVDARGLPRWPSSLRTGVPTLAGGELWPFDAELAGLEIGARTLIKRECFDVQSAAQDRAWLESRGLAVRDGAAGVLFAAKDRATLGADLDRAEEGVARGDADAAGWLGRALGYPACCIERFVSIRVRDDASLVAALLPRTARPPASPLSQWLNQPLTLVSHVPCALDCAPTLALGAALLDRIAATTPDWPAAWERLARRVQMVDTDGRCLALDVEGGTVRSAIELRLPVGPEPRGIVHEVPELAGTPLSSLEIFAIADHSAPR